MNKDALMDYFFGRKEETNGYSRLEGVWIEADTLEFAIYKFTLVLNKYENIRITLQRF